MNCLIIYHSRSGHTQGVANALAKRLQSQDHSVSIKSVIEVQAKHIQAADLIFIGTWVQGFIVFGVKPAGADLWVPSLPSLDNKPVALFCTYAFNPRQSLNTLKYMLEEKGAHIIAQQAFQRNQSMDEVGSFVTHSLEAHQRVSING